MPVTIRRNDDGSIDEVVASGVNVQLEQLSDTEWSFILSRPDCERENRS